MLVGYIQHIKVLDLVYAYKLPRNLKDGQGLMLLFFKIDAELSTVEISGEHIEYKWVGEEEFKTIGDTNDDAYISDGYKKAVELCISTDNSRNNCTKSAGL